MKCCFTGHRYFPWSSDPESSEYRALIERLDQAIDQVLAKGVIHFICGNAVGVDTWAAERVLQRKAENPEIFLEIALPFSDHNRHESGCLNVQSKADLVHVVSTEKSRIARFCERDKYMVDHSNILIAVYDKSRFHSGTAKTVAYARKQGLEILTISIP